MWSLGCVVAELLSGTHLFNSNTPRNQVFEHISLVRPSVCTFLPTIVAIVSLGHAEAFRTASCVAADWRL